jgi:hypothetical protein
MQVLVAYFLLSEGNMAVHKPLKALTKVQIARIAADAAKSKAFRQQRYGIAKPVINSDAHVQAYRDHLIANFTGKVNVIRAGRALEAQKFFQRDYRSFTPKGVILVSPRLRGTCQRFGVR